MRCLPTSSSIGEPFEIPPMQNLAQVLDTLKNEIGKKKCFWRHLMLWWQDLKDRNGTRIYASPWQAFLMPWVLSELQEESFSNYSAWTLSIFYELVRQTIAILKHWQIRNRANQQSCDYIWGVLLRREYMFDVHMIKSFWLSRSMTIVVKLLLMFH